MTRNRLLGTICVAILFAAMFACSRAQTALGPSAQPLSIAATEGAAARLAPVTSVRAKNVILIIGDGMGLSQMTAGRIALRGKDGRLAMETLPFAALVRTHSSSGLITDSAAAGTAIATGTRTMNGSISVTPEGARLPTILEGVRDRGFATGLVTTARITDATPAAFASHVVSREEEGAIAEQLLSSRVDVLLGCGGGHFTPILFGGQRDDGRDLIDEARGSGYVIARSEAELATPNTGKVLGLFEETSRPKLASLTRAALGTLQKSPNGFFVMIESEETDSASHNNDLPRLLRGMEELDDAVRVALEFATADGNTLVIVTADHETGGLQIVGGDEPGTLRVLWAGKHHTAQPVPLFAWGPGSQNFRGEIDNVEISGIIRKALQLETSGPARPAPTR